MKRRFCSLFFFLAVAFSFSQVSPAERAALIALFNATDGSNWNTNTNWNTAAVADTWHGVTVTGGSVTRIVLENNNLNGTLPAEIGNFPNLQQLHLGNNQISGSLPSALGNLTSISSLRVNGNSITGSLPASLGNLVNLAYFYIHNNQISGAIPPEMGNCTAMYWVLMGSNQLAGPLPPELENWTNCWALQLGSNQITGAIPPEWGNMANMEQLNLGNNQMTGAIPSELGNLSLLTHLYISNNQFTGAIPASFTALNDLYQLHVSNNQLSGTIPDLTALTGLGFDSNSIEFLWIDGNQYEFGDFENEFVSYNTNMTSLDVSPQGMLDTPLTLNQNSGDNITLTTTVPSGTQLHYTWYKDNVVIAGAPDSPMLSLSNIQTSDAGMYRCDVSSDIVTSLTLQRQPITLAISAAPPGPSVSISATSDEKCDIDTNLITLSAIVSPAAATGTYTYAWYIQGNPTVLSSNSTFDVSPVTSTTYVVVITDDGLPAGANSGNAVQTITVIGTPQFNPIGNVTACTSYVLPPITGNYLSGTGQYNDGTNGTGNYYAPGDTIHIGDFSSYPVTFYAYDENIGASTVCVDELMFTLTLIDPITADPGTNVTACDSYTLPSLSANNSYWSNSGGTGTGYNPGDSITTDTTLYIFADNGGCTDESQFTISIISITADVLSNTTGCIDYVLPSLSPNNNYYTQANKGGTPLNSGDVISTSSTIYIFAETGISPNTCSDESSFTVTITGVAVADNFENIQACESYTLPVLSTNNRYFDQMGSAGTEYFAGDVITSNMTLYIYAGIPGCSAETDFEITLDTPVNVSELEDVRVCENYVLPEITSGRYFTQTQGQGTELFAFGVIDNTQLIYIYNESGACIAESDFLVTIDCSPPAATTCVSFPKFFTPNLDGAHDNFGAIVDAACTINGIVSVYDRYGKLMKQFNAANDYWDGTYNGLAAPSTDYWYHFIDTETSAVVKGHFALKR